MNRRMMLKCAIAFGSAMVWASHVSGGSLLSGPFAPKPRTDEAAYLVANEPAIMSLAAQAKMGETDSRRAALETLANSYPEASLNLATELIKDSETAIATDSAKLLADTLAMTGSLAMGTSMYAAGTPAKQWLDAAIANLREAVADGRIEVRHVAAGTLAALGDLATLDKIEECVEQGVVPALEAIDYFGLAPRDLGGKYMEKYLDSGSQEAKVAAVGYLGTVLNYQPRIRELILNNLQVDDVVLLMAAGVLSRYDKTFPSYALEVAGRSDLPRAVSDTVVRAYVSNALKIKKRNPVVWKMRVQAVDKALMQHPDGPPLQMIKSPMACSRSPSPSCANVVRSSAATSSTTGRHSTRCPRTSS